MPLSQLTLETEYRSAQCDLAASFYRPCLELSRRYDRAVGYFSSTVFLVFGTPIVEFARRGGSIRLICSPRLTAEDIEALQSAHDTERIMTARLLEELETLIRNQDLMAHTTTLARLVAAGSMKIRIAIRTHGHGIYHEKLGIFEDEATNAVSFLGSSNETWNGWHPNGNYEVNEVFCSWQGDTIRVNKHRSHFERLWQGNDPAVRIFEFPEAVRGRLVKIAEAASTPAVPTEPSAVFFPREHQLAAIENWHCNGCRGILQHATGSGKTITALLAMREHLAGGGVVLVLVPSSLLLRQWHKECRKFHQGTTVLLVGAGNDEWKSGAALRSFSDPDPLVGGRLILATMQTARTDAFLRRFKQGEHVLIVADEVHQIGSAQNSRILALNAGKRLGMSATPHRYGDAIGTQRIFDYFGAVLEPIYTLADAISDRHLVPYEYHAHAVRLTEEESERWSKLSKDLNVLRARAKLGPGQGFADRAERLLMERARIAKKAHDKTALAVKVLREHFASGQRWLVYCEDREQLTDVVRSARGFIANVVEYYSSMNGDPEGTLRWFECHASVLVAINCLDEGIDIPSISHALILASSRNPRQFIQRRGRVLRRAPDKTRAVIHDVIVVPGEPCEASDQDGLLRSELRRALEFAASAANASARLQLRAIALAAGMDPDSIDDLGDEEEEGEGDEG